MSVAVASPRASWAEAVSGVRLLVVRTAALSIVELQPGPGRHGASDQAVRLGAFHC